MPSASDMLFPPAANSSMFIPRMPAFVDYNSTKEWNTWFSPYPYELVLIGNAIKKCYGCRLPFAEKYRKSPDNCIVRHRDKRIVSVNPSAYDCNFAFTYYHLHIEHIIRKNPLFSGKVSVALDGNISKTQIEMAKAAGFDVQISVQ